MPWPLIWSHSIILFIKAHFSCFSCSEVIGKILVDYCLRACNLWINVSLKITKFLRFLSINYFIIHIAKAIINIIFEQEGRKEIKNKEKDLNRIFRKLYDAVSSLMEFLEYSFQHSLTFNIPDLRFLVQVKSEYYHACISDRRQKYRSQRHMPTLPPSHKPTPPPIYLNNLLPFNGRKCLGYDLNSCVKFV